MKNKKIETKNKPIIGKKFKKKVESPKIKDDDEKMEKLLKKQVQLFLKKENLNESNEINGKQKNKKNKKDKVRVSVISDHEFGNEGKTMNKNKYNEKLIKKNKLKQNNIEKIKKKEKKIKLQLQKLSQDELSVSNEPRKNYVSFIKKNMGSADSGNTPNISNGMKEIESNWNERSDSVKKNKRKVMKATIKNNVHVDVARNSPKKRNRNKNEKNNVQKKDENFVISGVTNNSNKKNKMKSKGKVNDSNKPETISSEKNDESLSGGKRKRKRKSKSVEDFKETKKSKLQQKNVKNAMKDNKVIVPNILTSTVGEGGHKKEKYYNSKHTPLRDKLMNRLKASRFRFLNEQLYTSKSEESKDFFHKDPESFKAYHEGFTNQVKQWPINPIDIIIKTFKQKYENDTVIADLGCGEAKLAYALPDFKIHSLDLIALNDKVTPCDMTHTPLRNGTVDVAVFCLSLMGTDLSACIKEANRILKEGGEMKIAEVESRFKDINTFVSDVEKYGFKQINVDLSHDVFYFMDFEKVSNLSKNQRKKLPEIQLKACLYKKR